MLSRSHRLGSDAARISVLIAPGPLPLERRIDEVDVWLLLHAVAIIRVSRGSRELGIPAVFLLLAMVKLLPSHQMVVSPSLRLLKGLDKPLAADFRPCSVMAGRGEDPTLVRLLVIELLLCRRTCMNSSSCSSIQ